MGRRLFRFLIAASMGLICTSWPLSDVRGQTPDDAEAEPTPVYSLEALLKRATTNTPVVDERQAEIRKAEWQQYRARYGWTPKLEATSLLAPVPADADPTRFDENIDEILNFNLGPYFRQSARLVIPVYTFGRLSTARELAAIGVDVAHLQERQALLEVNFQVQRAFYGLQMSREFEKLLAEGDELVNEQLEEMEEARDFGEAEFDVADLRRLQIFNAELDAMILDNERLSDLAAEGLRYLANLDGEVRLPSLDTSAAPPLEDLDYYLQLAREHRPEVALLDQAVQARGLQSKLKHREFFPNVFVAADFAFGWSTEDAALQPIFRCPGTPDQERCVQDETLFARPYANPFDTLSFGVALGLNWRFDFFQQYGQYQEAKALTDQVVAQRERALGAMRLEVTQLYRDAADARAKIDIQRRRLNAARRWRDQFGLRMEVAAQGDLKDAIDLLRAYYDARRLFIQAHGEYRIARAALARGVGLRRLEDAQRAAPRGGQNGSIGNEE